MVDVHEVLGTVILKPLEFQGKSFLFGKVAGRAIFLLLLQCLGVGVVRKEDDRALKFTEGLHRIDGNDVRPDAIRSIGRIALRHSEPGRDEDDQDHGKEGDGENTRANVSHDALPSVMDLPANRLDGSALDREYWEAASHAFFGFCIQRIFTCQMKF